MPHQQGRVCVKQAKSVSEKDNTERAYLALGRFPLYITAREGCPLKVMREFNQNHWNFVISSVKQWSEMSSVTLLTEQGRWKESLNNLLHKSGKRSRYIPCMRGKPQPFRAFSLTEQVRPKSWGEEQALCWSYSPHPAQRAHGDIHWHSLRKGQNREIRQNKGHLWDGSVRIKREFWQIIHENGSYSNFEKENQPEKFKIE